MKPEERDEDLERILAALPHLSIWVRLEILWMIRWFCFRNMVCAMFPTLAARLLLAGLVLGLLSLALAAVIP